MPDITKCTNHDCPFSWMCFRYVVQPSYWQSYFVGPYEHGYCKHFWFKNYLFDEPMIQKSTQI